MRSEKIDDIFRSAYEDFEQEPSEGAWQKINTKLDGKTIVSYKRRLKAWRGAALLLLFLCVGFILFEGPFALNGGRKQSGLTNTVPSPKAETKSKEYHEFSHTERVVQSENIVTKGIPAMVIPRSTDSRVSLRANEPSIHSDEDLIASNIKSNTVPLANQFSISTLNIAAPRLSSEQPIVIHQSVTKASPWTLTGLITYERTNYRLDSDLPPSDGKSLIQEREEHESSFSIGILATHPLKERWSVETGLIYSNTSIGIKPEKMYASHDNQGNIGFKYVTSSGYSYVKPGFAPSPSVGDSLTTAVASHKLQSLSVPFSVKYLIPFQRLSLQPGVGVAINFFTSTKVETEIEDAFNRESVIINKLEGALPIYLSLIAAANLQYRLNNRWSLNCVPTFKYALTSITKDNVVQTFPYSFGIGLGLTIRF